jgi:ATP phosphoribosyltransferase
VAVVDEADMQICRAMDVVGHVVHGAVGVAGKEKAQEGNDKHFRTQSREYCRISFNSARVVTHDRKY